MTSPIDAPYALSYRVPIGHKPVNRLVSEIFSIKVAETQTDTDTSTDNEGCLKLSRAANSIHMLIPTEKLTTIQKFITATVF